jgi:hypothetical protein
MNAPARLNPTEVGDTSGVKVTSAAAGPKTLSDVVRPGNQTPKVVGLKLKVASPIAQLPREMTDANDPVTHVGDARTNPGTSRRAARTSAETRLRAPRVTVPSR